MASSPRSSSSWANWLRQGLAEHLAALGQLGAAGQDCHQVPLPPALRTAHWAAALGMPTPIL